jgi:cellulose synthase/poly-beta-1,6-N-acetylglucosamine synthase-like glycosyltransferase
MPVRNGEAWIARKIETLLGLDYDAAKLQIVVVSDGSTDRTAEIAAAYVPKIEIVHNPPLGKAAALNSAMDRATGDVLFFTDVRQDLDPESLKHLVRRLTDPQTGVCSGELMIRSGETLEEANVGLYWRLEKWIRKQHCQIDSVLGATGAIYAMKRHLAVPVPAGTLLDDVFLPMSAVMAGYRSLFVAEARAYDEPTKLQTEFRRKVRTLAGVYQLFWLLPGIAGPSNRMWFHWWSHKLGRLAAPHLLLATFICSLFLPAVYRWPAVGLQLAFYLLAWADRYVPPSPLKRLSSLARTFVVLMAAAFCAIAIVFQPNREFWTPPRKGA